METSPKEQSKTKAAKCHKILASLNLAKQKKISPAGPPRRSHNSNGKQEEEKSEPQADKWSAIPNAPNDKACLNNIISPSRKSDNIKSRICRTFSHASSWAHCSWNDDEVSFASNAASDGDSVYHVLDDTVDGECLDVSDSKRLSLMDILMKDELSFKKSLGK